MKGIKHKVAQVKHGEIDTVKNFDELAMQLQYAALATQTQIDVRRLKKLFGKCVGNMTLRELYKISAAIGIHYELLTDLAVEKMKTKVKQKTKQG